MRQCETGWRSRLSAVGRAQRECLGIVSPDVELCRPSFDGLTFWLDVNAIVSEPLPIGSIFAVEWSWHEIRLSTVLFRIDRIELVTHSIMFCLYRAIILNGPTLGYRLTEIFKEWMYHYGVFYKIEDYEIRFKNTFATL